MPDAALALRVLSSPGSVLACTLLVLNDHVLKQAWPGLVTGKLSDVAGLVFAPLLLAFPLAAVRVRRPPAIAVAATGLGFVLTKSSETGASVASDVWSLTGIPTTIRADPTDLVALPALGLAWWIHARVRREVLRGTAPRGRRVLALALGTAMLPVGVLATAATSCDPDEGVTSVGVVEGRFPGVPEGVERRLGLERDHDRLFTLDRSATFADPAVETSGPMDRVDESCVGARCWRLRDDVDIIIEASKDRGRTWSPEHVLPAQVRERIADENDSCGGSAIDARGVAVLDTGGEPLVGVALGRGGLLLRRLDGTWWHLSSHGLDREVPDPPAPEPSAPTVTPIDQRGPRSPA